MTVEKLPDYLRTHWPAIRAALLDRAMAPSVVPDPKLLKEGKDHVGAALTVATDQARALGALVEQNRGLDIKDMLALFVAVLGGVSTIILSWRKDLREARNELRKANAEGPQIVLRGCRPTRG
jgi:hypothetical protein